MSLRGTRGVEGEAYVARGSAIAKEFAADACKSRDNCMLGYTSKQSEEKQFGGQFLSWRWQTVRNIQRGKGSTLMCSTKSTLA